MASLIWFLLHFNEPGSVKTWISGFAVHARRKKLKDNKSYGGKNEISDLFLATAACEAIKKISWVTYPRELEKLTFNQIKEIIRKNIRPKKRLS